MATQAALDQAQQLYVTYYGRPADAAGLAFWADKIDEKGVDAVINDFGTSAEFEARFGSLTSQELVENLYQQMFNRAADAEGLQFYTERLDDGRLTLAEIAATIAGGAQNDDVTILSNKVAAANLYTAAAGDAHSGTEADNYAAEFLAGVVVDTDVDALDIDAVVADIPQPSVPGDAFSLTADADDLTGTANDDTFTAGLSAAGVQSLQDFDRVDGGEGTDQLSATLLATAGNGDFSTVGQGDLANVVTSVENFYLRSLDNAVAVDFTDIDEVEQIWSDRAQGDLTVTRVEDQVTLGAIRGQVDNAGAATADFNVQYADGVLASNVSNLGRLTQNVVLNSANVASLSITAQTAGDFAPAGTAGAVATSSTLELDLTGDSQVGIDVSANTFGAVLDTITTTGEGSLDLDLGALTGNLTVSLGAGDDTLRLDGTDLDGNDEINLGGGENTLRMTGFGDLDPAGDGSEPATVFSGLNLAGVENAQNLQFDGAAAIADGGDSLNLGDRDNVTFAGQLTADTAGNDFLVRTTSSELTVNFSAGVGATAPDLVVGRDVSDLTINVGTAQGGADLTLDSLTNQAGTDGSLTSLETLTIADVRGRATEGQDFTLDLVDTRGLTTIDLSAAGQQEADYDNTQAIGAGNTDSVVLDASGAAFGGPVTIQIGEVELDYTNASNNLREVFQFVGDEISNVEISAFTVTGAGNGDKLDFSQFADVSSINDLAINAVDTTTDGNADSWVITAADGQFEGAITLAGIAGVEQSTLEANAFIF